MSANGPMGRAAGAIRREGAGFALAWAGVFCLGTPGAGAFIAAVAAVASFAARPSEFLGGLGAHAVARAVERFAGRAAEPRVAINALLLGLGVGYGFDFGPGWCALVAAAGLYATLWSARLLGWSAQSGLPILSVPFATGYILLQVATPRLVGVVSYDMPATPALCPAFAAALPAWAAAFFKNLALLVFVPDVTAGALFFAALLVSSRLLAVYGALGFLLGTTLLGLWCGNPEAALAHASGFNFTLIGFALGAFFLIPSWRSLGWTLGGVTLGVFLTLALGAFFEKHGASPSTLPFNLTVILTLALLRHGHSALIPTRHRVTPEATLEAEHTARARFGEGPSLALPFEGCCRVYQAFDGPWTHRGLWRHAYDFVRCDASGRSYRNAGEALEDYHLYGLTVLAPAAGVVVACRDDLPDNAPGTIDHVNNWGNFVIIRMACGRHVELSHLRMGSLRVRPGDAVRVGEALGECGNSGYSMYPHLHLQVQSGPWLGDATLPFNFAQAVYGGRIRHACLPPVDTDVEAPVFSRERAPLVLTLGEVLVFTDSAPGRADRRAVWTVRRTADIHARFYLEDERGNRLAFTADEFGYLALEYTGATSAALAFFALALPRLPNVAACGRWRDVVPPSLVRGAWSREWRRLATAYGASRLCRADTVSGVWRYDAEARRVTAVIPARGGRLGVALDLTGRPYEITDGRRRLFRPV